MIRAAVVDSDGVVVNVVVLPDNWDPDAEGAWKSPDGHTVTENVGRAGLGWRSDGAGGFLPPPVRTLTVNRGSIPPDGATPAVVTYRDTHDNAPTEVTFDVNGATETETLDADGVASIEIVADQAGPITVTVDVPAVEPVTITATDEEPTP